VGKGIWMIEFYNIYYNTVLIRVAISNDTELGTIAINIRPLGLDKGQSFIQLAIMAKPMATNRQPKSSMGDTSFRCLHLIGAHLGRVTVDSMW